MPISPYILKRVMRSRFDWSEEPIVLGGMDQRIKVAHFRLCHSRKSFVVAYPGESQEMVLDRVVAWVSQRSERALTLEHGHMTASNSGRPRSVISLRTVTAILTSVFWFSKLRAFSFGPMTPFQRPICVSTLLR